MILAEALFDAGLISKEKKEWAQREIVKDKFKRTEKQVVEKKEQVKE